MSDTKGFRASLSGALLPPAKGEGPSWGDGAKIALALSLVGIGTAGIIWTVLEAQDDDSDYDTQTDQVLRTHGYTPSYSSYGYYTTPGGRTVSRPTAIAEVGAVDPGAFRGVSRGGFGGFVRSAFHGGGGHGGEGGHGGGGHGGGGGE